MSAPSPRELILGDVLNSGARVLRDDWTPEAKKFVRQRGRKYLRDLRKYDAALRAGASSRARGREYLIEHSFAGRFCALLLNYPRIRSAPGRKGAKPLTLGEAKKLAGQVKTRQCSGEPVHVTVRAKADGGTRHTCAFGPRTRAANYLADSFLAMRWGECAQEFSRRGRGRDAAIREALSAYQHGGVRSFVHVDVQNCYGSIGMEGVKEPYLPKTIREHTLAISPEAKVIIHNDTEHPGPSDQAVRAGIPQGLRSSARIASHVLRSATVDLDFPLLIFHGDDILAGIRKGQDEEAAKSALVSAIAGHPAGPLLHKLAASFGLNSGHDYLGYEFRRRPKRYGGYAKARPSEKAYRRGRSRMARKLALVPVECLLTATQRAVEAWSKAFGAWEGQKAGAEIAEITFAIDVAPILTKFQKHLRHLGWIKPPDAMALFDKYYAPTIAKLPLH